MTVWSFTHTVKKHVAILDADISKVIFVEENERKVPFYVCYSNTERTYSDTAVSSSSTHPALGTTL